MLQRVKFCDMRCHGIENPSLWRIDSVARGDIHTVLLLGQEITWLTVMYWSCQGKLVWVTKAVGANCARGGARSELVTARFVKGDDNERDDIRVQQPIF